MRPTGRGTGARARGGAIMTLAFYRLLGTLGLPLIRGYLAWRRVQGKEDADRFGERLGHPGRPRPDGTLVWVHAASVGESLSLLPLVERLGVARPGINILITTGTVTSAALLAERLPNGAIHQYVPVDRRAYVRRFLDHWRPDLVLWAESEFWPNLITEPAARSVPMVLVQGRVSAGSFRGWQRAPGLIRLLLSGFRLCLGQSEGDAERLRRLGAPVARCVGNLKYAAPPLPADADTLAALETAIDGRPMWLAASTHAGEEDIAGRAHGRLADSHPGLLTVIVPRHPTRGGDVSRALAATGLVVARRGAGEIPTSTTQVYVADTLGELGLFYRLAEIVYVGKSLVPLGGQNPLEPARLDCALLFGPHTANFADITDRLTTAKAALEVADETALADAVHALLNEPTRRQAMAKAAHAVADAEADSLDAVIEELMPFLEACAPSPPEDHARA